MEIVLGRVFCQVLRKAPFYCRVGPLKAAKRIPRVRQDLVSNSVISNSESERSRLRTFDMESESERPESAAYHVFDFTSCSRSAAPLGASIPDDSMAL